MVPIVLSALIHARALYTHSRFYSALPFLVSLSALCLVGALHTMPCLCFAFHVPFLHCTVYPSCALHSAFRLFHLPSVWSFALDHLSQVYPSPSIPAVRCIHCLGCDPHPPSRVYPLLSVPAVPANLCSGRSPLHVWGVLFDLGFGNISGHQSVALSSLSYNVPCIVYMVLTVYFQFENKCTYISIL